MTATTNSDLERIAAELGEVDPDRADAEAYDIVEAVLNEAAEQDLTLTNADYELLDYADQDVPNAMVTSLVTLYTGTAQ